MASFVSAKALEAAKALKKQQKREAREVILKHAKLDHERQRKRKELREERGEDDWMAPGLMNRLAVEEKDHSSRKRKKHKSKSKQKREKRSKLSKNPTNSSDGEESGDELWVEKDQDVGVVGDQLSHSSSWTASNEEATSLKRDSWMTAPMEPLKRSLVAIHERQDAEGSDRKAENKEKVSLFDNPGQHPRELNPYWKDGGTGLPDKERNPGKQSSTRTGDGGRSWILRAYKRALEQAEKEGRDFESIAIRRWGSLDKLYALLHAAGIDPSNPDKVPGSQKREYLYAEPPQASNHSSLEQPSSISSRRVKADFKKPSSGFLLPDQMQSIDSSPSHVRAAGSMPHGESTTWRKDNPITTNPNTKTSPSGYDHNPSQASQSTQEVSQTPLHAQPEVTDSQLNALSAKVMKAEMLGDTNKCKTLKAKLEKLRKLKSEQKWSTKQEAPTALEEKTIALVSTDRFGRVRPLDMPKGNSGQSQRSNLPHQKKGKRKKYADDGKAYSLQDLMEQERKMSAKDTQLAIAGMASKFVSSSSTDDTIDDRHASKVAISFDPKQNEDKEKMQAIYESRKLAETIETCKLCFGNDNFSKSLLIAIGMNVYLAVPASQSLTKGHCLLVPMEHNTSMILLDENVWDEVKVFQKGLTRMFSDHGFDVVFTETYTSGSKKSHAYIECIPLPKEQGDLAPMYFKKAILESDEEWSMNRKLIDTRQKGVRRSLPAGLPYFFVEFGLDGGFAHIVEDHSSFPSYFAKEVIGGMLDIEPRLWLKPHQDNFESQRSKVLELSDWWKPYDWTQKLKS